MENSGIFPSSMANTIDSSDAYELYDLRIEVVCPPNKRILCGAKEGDYFTLEGEMLHLPPEQGISIYSLGELFRKYRTAESILTRTIASVLPLLAAKQRMTHEHDWMSTDALVQCPDPNCPSQLRIIRTGKRVFSHAASTAVPLKPRTEPGETS